MQICPGHQELAQIHDIKETNQYFSVFQIFVHIEYETAKITLIPWNDRGRTIESPFQKSYSHRALVEVWVLFIAQLSVFVSPPK